jgi:membrane associated rhomboid family serine protease
VSDAQHDPENYCYRHPDRQSYILCQRCGRTVCPECSTQAAVGVHCPECVKEARQSAPKRKPRLVTAFRRSSSTPVVTYTLIAINLVMFALQWLSGGAVTTALYYAPYLTAIEPWTMLTSAFLHSQGSFFHILFNMYALFAFGPALESMLGRGRYIALYLLTAFGGSVGVLLLGTPEMAVLGASGAIFGLLGAYFVMARGMGGNTTQLVIVIALNLGIGFLFPNSIAWQAHVGGLVTGLLIAFIFLRTRREDRKAWQIGLLIATAIVLVAVTILAVVLKGYPTL